MIRVRQHVFDRRELNYEALPVPCPFLNSNVIPKSHCQSADAAPSMQLWSQLRSKRSQPQSHAHLRIRVSHL